jgi:hypothetical protein
LAWGCGLDSTGSGQGPVAGCCECGGEPSGSCATELVSYPESFLKSLKKLNKPVRIGDSLSEVQTGNPENWIYNATISPGFLAREVKEIK